MQIPGFQAMRPRFFTKSVINFKNWLTFSESIQYNIFRICSQNGEHDRFFYTLRLPKAAVEHILTGGVHE